jgi:adenylate cyclase
MRVHQYRTARRVRANLNRAIRYYLPDRIASRLAEAPLDLQATDEEVYAVCMVTDAEGFTHIAEGMSSRTLKPFLNAYLTILFGAVERHGGIVTDTVGDGVTAVWPSPASDPAMAAKACAAALEIDRAVQAFNEVNDPMRLPTRIGLHAGRVTLGHVGGGGRFAYTVIGDAVNTASRIEQLNKELGTRILATGDMQSRVPDLACRSLGPFRLRGKADLVEVVEILRSVPETEMSTLT